MNYLNSTVGSNVGSPIGGTGSTGAGLESNIPTTSPMVSILYKHVFVVIDMCVCVCICDWVYFCLMYIF